MTELYWITRLSALHYFFITLFIVALLGFLFVALVYFVNDDIDEDVSARCKKAVAPTLCVALFASLALTFIPSKNDLLLIYGVGGTIDYVKSDTTAQHIPEKVIKACDAYLDEITKGK